MSYYTIKTNHYMWLIDEEEHPHRFVLKYRHPPVSSVEWVSVNFGDSPEECAAFVANSETSHDPWDELPHKPADFDLSKWVKDKPGLRH